MNNYLKMRLEDATVANHGCPTCHVAPGEWCVNIRGHRTGERARALHIPRISLHVRAKTAGKE